ncbi:MAG: hypothetical protein IJP68_06640, partial [Selenomonadaceae bacterium]|nr:hypothetical protein [Selenomonadaceae bacterium]
FTYSSSANLLAYNTTGLDSSIGVIGVGGWNSVSSTEWSYLNETDSTKKQGAFVATVGGVANSDGLTIDTSGKKVTVANSLLSESSTVTISGTDYKLALGSDVTAYGTVEAAFDSMGSGASVATYHNQYNTAGYSLTSDTLISYKTAETAKATLFTVSGIKSTVGLDVTEKTVTAGASALDEKDVSIDGTDYKLTLASGVSGSATSAAAWTYSDNVAGYTAAATTAGYDVDSTNNKIVYTEDNGGDTLNVTGVKSTVGLSIDGKTVTAGASALNETEVSITDGYSLTLASDVSGPTAVTEGFDAVSDNSAIYHSNYTSAGYTLAKNVISYSEETGKETIFTLNNVTSTADVSIADVGSDKVVVVTKGNLAGSATPSVTKGTATETYKLTAVEYNSAKTAATVATYEDGVSITSAIFGSNKVATVSAAGNANAIAIAGDATLKNITGGDGADNLTAGSAVASTLDGGAGADTLTGSSKADSLKGGDGADLFITNGGSDTIADYAAGDV